MKNDIRFAEINMAKIPADSNIAGIAFAVSTVMICIIGIPLLRYIFPGAIAAGCGIAVLLHFLRRGGL